MRKIFLILPFIIWILLFFIDFSSIVLQKNKPMYFRAWEYVLNEGKDGYYVPFQPLISYTGFMQGDLLKMANFLPEKQNISPQLFTVDEYGFRNRKNLMQGHLEAVTVGTSFVGGAHETQNNLISEILTDKYNIPTYNYSTLPLQHFWEDNRFIANTPHYLVIIANESEILQNTWVEVLKDTQATHSVAKWESHDEWEKANIPSLTYDLLIQYLSRFSLTKYELHQIYLSILNVVLPRQIIALSGAGIVTYDPNTDFLFFDVGRYNPLYTKDSKVALQNTIQTLTRTRDVLRKRNIQLIVAVMPSKASLYYPEYRKRKLTDKILSYLEKEMDDNGIISIKLLKVMTDIAEQKDHSVYFKDDTHWTEEPNYYIANELQKIINQNSHSL